MITDSVLNSLMIINQTFRDFHLQHTETLNESYQESISDAVFQAHNLILKAITAQRNHVPIGYVLQDDSGYKHLIVYDDNERIDWNKATLCFLPKFLRHDFKILDNEAPDCPDCIQKYNRMNEAN